MFTKVFLLAFAAVVAVWAQPATIASCGGYMKLTNLSVTPATPQAGQTVYVNGTGILPQKVTGGTGQINAYLYGANAFSAPINTCGLGQNINVLDMASGTLDALPCPVAPGAHAQIGFVMAIPSIAGGLGSVNITVNATDSNNVPVFCIDAVVNL
jgi:hypothetical protein